MAVPLSSELLVVFGLILVALVLFATEYVSPDITALSVLVALVILESWTGIGVEDAFVGFSNPATVTVAAMYMLSEGVRRTGVVRRLGATVSRIARGSKQRLLGTVLALTGTMAGIVNNTPVVAVFIPMVNDLADTNHVSPSKLLIPLSYTAMLGGTLTIVGSSTNLLASTLSARLLDHPFSMFEFTSLGLLGLVVGVAYLMTIGQRLLPERIGPLVDLVSQYDLRIRLGRLYVREDSPLVGRTIGGVFADSDLDLSVIEVTSDTGRVVPPGPDCKLGAGDVLTVQADRQTVREFASANSLWLLPWVRIEDLGMRMPSSIGTLVEATVPKNSSFDEQRIRDVRFREQYSASVLAVLREGAETPILSGLPDVALETGDKLLLHTTAETVERLRISGDLVVNEVVNEGMVEPKPTDTLTYRENRIGVALAIVGGVVVAAALGLLPISISALAGVVAMVATGVLDPSEAYAAVEWNVIYLLAGMIPLGIAMENAGGTEFVANHIVANAGLFPPVVVVVLFYLLTAVLTNFVSNNASVVLMIPIAVDTATQIDANAFAFVLAVTFAASTSFLTPVGYQTNLMVYGPGGYRFTDYLRVGGPLQVLLAGVTTVGIWAFWGI